MLIPFFEFSDGGKRIHWSAPAARLARFLGDALGEALSEKQDGQYQILAQLRLNYCWNMLWMYSWHWESPEESSWCQRHSSRRCLSPLSEGFASSAWSTWQDFGCQTPGILKKKHVGENMKKPQITHRPCLQDLVHPKQHQNHQATQEDVHEHPTEKQLFKSLKYHWDYTCIQDHATAEAYVSPGVLLVHCPDLCPHRSYEQRQKKPIYGTTANVQHSRLNWCNLPAMIQGGKAPFALFD